MIFRDALLRLLPSSIPPSFEALDADEQAWRGRVFLMTWALGGDASISWAMALNREAVHTAEMKAFVEREADDEQIRGAVEARRNEERAAARLGIDDLR